MTVWDRLVGQPTAVQTFAAAAADAARILAGQPGPAMTHAWLVTGPPGSGRSTAALEFAAALQCPEQGCGTCQSCRMVQVRGHPDVDQFTPERLQITVGEAEALISRANLQPVHGRWNVLIIEDADRLNEISGNSLLKAIEEPNSRTVWLLCAPTRQDVLPTIASRTRQVNLRTPSNAEVSAALVDRFGVDPAMAAFAARAAAGHIGRARALALDEQVRRRRHEVLGIPGSLRSLGDCLQAAANLLESATADAASITDALDARETAEVIRALGQLDGGPGAARLRRATSAALKDLEVPQKSRRTRVVRDQLDRALLDLIGLFRDALVVQLRAPVDLINAELRGELETLARRLTTRQLDERIAALEHARLAIAASVAPLLAMEALMVRLAGFDRSG